MGVGTLVVAGAEVAVAAVIEIAGGAGIGETGAACSSQEASQEACRPFLASVVSEDPPSSSQTQAVHQGVPWEVGAASLTCEEVLNVESQVHLEVAHLEVERKTVLALVVAVVGVAAVVLPVQIVALALARGHFHH
mmetsp:Transcript_65979/g.132884  ORF Transcript_65979/g.132884 Transcript_65979/m.132884 type:complete len:136 (-) Transcript_65979:95-502(-)